MDKYEHMNDGIDEEGNVNVMEHLLIRDVTTDEIVLNKRPYQKEIKNDDQ